MHERSSQIPGSEGRRTNGFAAKRSEVPGGARDELIGPEVARRAWVGAEPRWDVVIDGRLLRHRSVLFLHQKCLRTEVAPDAPARINGNSHKEGLASTA